MDYYRQLEAKIEERKDRFNVEICIQASYEYLILVRCYVLTEQDPSILGHAPAL